MDEYLGSCNRGECERACPKSISIDLIAGYAGYAKAKFENRHLVSQTG